MIAALELIQQSLSTDEPLDYARLGSLHAAFAHYTYNLLGTDTYFDEDDYEVTADAGGNVLSRVESSPSIM